MNLDHLDQFTRAYIAAAYFTETGDSGQPDSSAELSADAIARASADCARFQRITGAELRDACSRYGYSCGQAGHDFWLTRNGHGAGFWDRKVLTQTEDGSAPDTLGERLTELARQAGECGLYQGDDGLLYFA